MPADTGVTPPDVSPIVATPGLLLVNESPGPVAQDMVPVVPMHKAATPVIGARVEGLTVTSRVTEQPPLTAYVIVVIPAALPLTTPVVPTVAIAVLLLLHVPPAVVLASVVDRPGVTVAVPVMPASVLMVTIAVAVLPDTL